MISLLLHVQKEGIARRNMGLGSFLLSSVTVSAAVATISNKSQLVIHALSQKRMLDVRGVLRKIKIPHQIDNTLDKEFIKWMHSSPYEFF